MPVWDAEATGTLPTIIMRVGPSFAHVARGRAGSRLPIKPAAHRAPLRPIGDPLPDAWSVRKATVLRTLPRGAAAFRFGLSSFQDPGEVLTVEVVRVG